MFVYLAFLFSQKTGTFTVLVRGQNEEDALTAARRAAETHGPGTVAKSVIQYC